MTLFTVWTTSSTTEEEHLAHPGALFEGLQHFWPGLVLNIRSGLESPTWNLWAVQWTRPVLGLWSTRWSCGHAMGHAGPQHCQITESVPVAETTRLPPALKGSGKRASPITWSA
jgi:hypothetical protein